MEQFQWISLFGTTMVVNGIAYLTLKLLQITIMHRVQNMAPSVNLAEDSVMIDPQQSKQRSFACRHSMSLSHQVKTLGRFLKYTKQNGQLKQTLIWTQMVVVLQFHG